jgi:FkbM family methyltransferase
MTSGPTRRPWLYYARSYVRVLLAFRNGPNLVLNHHTRSEWNQAILWNGIELRGPAGRGGFVDTLVEIWGEETYTAGFYTPRDGDVVFDVGANIGLFSVWIARSAPAVRVVAFEPFPENFAALERNLAVCDHDVRRYPFAVGPAPGFGRMQDGGSRSLDHELVPGRDDGAGNLVRVVSLAEAFEMANVDAVDLLKMDIEGGEYDIFAAPLPRTLMRRFRRIAIEYHEHRHAGTLASIQARLSETHSICSIEDSGEGYGILRAVLKS